MVERKQHLGMEEKIVMIGQQLTMPQLVAHLSCTRLAIGAAGEVLVARALTEAGYQVDISHDQGDLTTLDSNGQLLYVEVKTARRGKDGFYRFTLYKYWQNRVCADARHADFTVLLCVLKTGNVVPFVVPLSELRYRRSAAVSSYPWSYHGWLAPYRQDIRQLRLP